MRVSAPKRHYVKLAQAPVCARCLCAVLINYLALRSRPGRPQYRAARVPQRRPAPVCGAQQRGPDREGCLRRCASWQSRGHVSRARDERVGHASRAAERSPVSRRARSRSRKSTHARGHRHARGAACLRSRRARRGLLRALVTPGICNQRTSSGFIARGHTTPWSLVSRSQPGPLPRARIEGAREQPDPSQSAACCRRREGAPFPPRSPAPREPPVARWADRCRASRCAHRGCSWLDAKPGLSGLPVQGRIALELAIKPRC